MSKAVSKAETSSISRRDVLSVAFGAAATAAAVSAVNSPAKAADATAASGKQVGAGSQGGEVSGSRIITRDGVEIYYKDWGPKDGPVVVLSHGWPLSSD
ncbi:MAG: alpha/beta hydrolase, partial [Ensifer sp. SSB1]|nr:alpha/beta hydrolase [Ensifer sp. SSB1]